MRINEEIKAKEVRVVSSTAEQLGVMSLDEALKMATSQDSDLVEISPNAKPPVCKIMDYGKFRYEQQRKEKETKKKQKVIDVKEVKIRPNIEEHDYNVKLKNVQRFLNDGDKVKVTIMFRGREMAHPELGRKVLLRLAENVAEIANVEREPRLEGKNMIMILSAK